MKHKTSLEIVVKKTNFAIIKDRWLHYFDSLVLGPNLDSFDDLGSIVDILTDL